MTWPSMVPRNSKKKPGILDSSSKVADSRNTNNEKDLLHKISLGFLPRSRGLMLSWLHLAPLVSGLNGQVVLVDVHPCSGLRGEWRGLVWRFRTRVLAREGFAVRKRENIGRYGCRRGEGISNGNYVCRQVECL